MLVHEGGESYELDTDDELGTDVQVRPCPADCEQGPVFTLDYPNGKACPECDGEGRVVA